MKLLVCGKFELPYVGLHRFDHMISIQDPAPHQADLRPPHIPEGRYLYLEFSDTTDPDLPDAPTRTELRRLFDWMNQQDRLQSLLVHCDAGMRRSPAVALFCVTHFTSLSFEDAIGFVRENSATSYIWPNDLVCELCDQLAGAKGAAIQAVNEWKESNIEPI